MTLVDARGLLGWSQSKLSEESGVKASAISDIECDRVRDPGYTMVMRLIAALQRGGLSGLRAEDVFPVVQPKRKAS